MISKHKPLFPSVFLFVSSVHSGLISSAKPACILAIGYMIQNASNALPFKYC